MSIYYLYKKTHNKTGLQYLGQTTQDPYTYKGSGKDWLTHITEYGYDVNTEILLKTSNKSERNRVGRYYSNLWNIVESKQWANKIPETGGGIGANSNWHKSKLDSGTHYFQDYNWHSEHTRKMYAQGGHPFQDGANATKWNLDRVEAGTNPFVGTGINNQMLEDGSHPSQIRVSCLCCKSITSIANHKRWHGSKCTTTPTLT